MTRSECRPGTSQLTKRQLNAFAHWFNDILTRGLEEA
jgi:hypothetical protein